MSLLSQFSIKNIKTLIGEKAFNISSKSSQPSTLDSNTYVKSGSILLQSEYPELFSKIGLIDSYAWTETSLIGVIPWEIRYGNATYVYVSSAGLVGTSANGITWTARTSGTTSNILGLSYGNSTFVYGTVGGGLATSTDGITWTARTSGTTSTISSIAYGNSTFVYGTYLGGIATSTDGITWTARTSGTTSSIYSVIFANGVFLYGTYGGGLATSTNGITWTARTSGTTSHINALAYGNGLYVYGAAGGVLATSTDAITWTARTSGTTSAIGNIAYGNGIYIASVGRTNEPDLILTSSNGITWKKTFGSNSNSDIIYLGYENSTFFYGAGNIIGRSTNPTVPISAAYNIATQFKIPDSLDPNVHEYYRAK